MAESVPHHREAFSLDKSRKCTIEGCDKPRRTLGLCRAHRFRLQMHGDPLGGGTSKGGLKEWLKFHIAHTGDECLKWPFYCSNAGIAYAKINSKSIKAARLMCIMAHGEPPTPEHQAAHSCGKAHEGCVNPKHLRWATRTENEADKRLHGTDTRGTKNGGSRLTEANVIEMRRIGNAESNASMARRFGVNRSTVLLIKSGKSWRWLGNG